MKYCTKCVMPNTKPFLTFNNGICNACINHEKKNGILSTIDWRRRKIEFQKLMKKTKEKDSMYYDVLIPVSGGKDSIYQVSKVLEFTHKVLAVNVDYGIKTEVGKKNLSIITDKLGVDLITFRPDMILNKSLIKIGFEEYGDPDLFTHSLLYAYPIRIAGRFKISLVVFGEDTGFEYCGENDSVMNKRWFNKHARRQKPIIEDIHESRLKIYHLPKSYRAKVVFLSYYYFWNSERNLQHAKNYGFKTSNNVEGTYRNYAGVDEKINRIHQYMKFLKFGFGRATDHACEDIRNGKISREIGLELVKDYDSEFPSLYYIDDFCEFIDITKASFYRTLKKWDKYGVL